MAGRVKTFVKGLDYLLDGGIPKGSLVLVVGKPGTMKSSLVYSMLFRNALEDENKGLYIALEQSRSSLIANMRSMGMDHDEVKLDLSFIDLALIRKKLKQLARKPLMEALKMYSESLKKELGYKILAVDSLPVLELLADLKEPREEVFHLFEWLRNLGTTTLLVHEMQQEEESIGKYGEDYLVDGIVHLDMRRDQNNVNLFLGILKMRRTEIKRGYYPLIYDKQGFEIVVD